MHCIMMKEAVQFDLVSKQSGCYGMYYTPSSLTQCIVLSEYPSSCTLCHSVLVVSTSDKKYRFGVPFKVLTKQVGLYVLIISGIRAIAG